MPADSTNGGPVVENVCLSDKSGERSVLTKSLLFQNNCQKRALEEESDNSSPTKTFRAEIQVCDDEITADQ